MKHRLYLPDPGGSADIPAGTIIELSPDQTHYLARVLRLKPGAEVGVFDGCGREWRAMLVRLSAREATVKITELVRTETQPSPLILAQAWLKGSAMDMVVQKAVELGVTAIWLLQTDRCNVKVDDRRLDNKLTHLSRVIASAAEQCESLWLPELVCLDGFNALLDQTRPGRTLFLDPGQPPLEAGSTPAPITVVVGPEGGWSERERIIAMADPTVIATGLGALILRAETVPLAALAAIRQDWGWKR